MVERLTDRGIAALKPVAGKPYFVFDAEVSGLAVKVYQSGQRSFVFDWRENRKQHHVTMGQFPASTIGKARTHAVRMRVRVDVGDSVATGRGGRVADLIEPGASRPTDAPARNRHRLSRMIAVHTLPTSARPTRGDHPQPGRGWHGQIGARTPVHATARLGMLSPFLSWLDTITGSSASLPRRSPAPREPAPVLLERRPKSRPRTRRRGSRHQDRAGRAGAEAGLMVGCRIGEAIGITAEQIDIDRQGLDQAGSTTKQRSCTSTHCSRGARRLPRRCWICSGPK